MRLAALAYGLTCHTAFLAAVGAMGLGLWTGMQSGLGPFRGALAGVADLALLASFPLVHSWMLTAEGRRSIRRLAPAAAQRSLDTTLYATLTSLHLLAVFALWSPLGGPVWQATDRVAMVLASAYVGGWLLLGITMTEAGLGAQTGFSGWWAWFRGRPVSYPTLPTKGLHAACRHPIYAAFAMVLVAAPTWTLDRIALTLPWLAYCAFGPLLKEYRLAERHGATWDRYAAQAWWIA